MLAFMGVIHNNREQGGHLSPPWVPPLPLARRPCGHVPQEHQSMPCKKGTSEKHGVCAGMLHLMGALHNNKNQEGHSHHSGAPPPIYPCARAQQCYNLLSPVQTLDSACPILAI